MNCPVCNQILLGNFTKTKLECPETDEINPNHQYEVVLALGIENLQYKNFTVTRRQNPISLMSSGEICDHTGNIVKTYDTYPSDSTIIQDVLELASFLRCPRCNTAWAGPRPKSCQCGMVPVHYVYEYNTQNQTSQASANAVRLTVDQENCKSQYQITWDKINGTCLVDIIKDDVSVCDPIKFNPWLQITDPKEKLWNKIHMHLLYS
jgi:hypothetical protein